MISIVM